MRWPLSIQIFVPFALLLTTVVASLTAFSSWATNAQSYQQTLTHSQSIARSLSESTFPITQAVAKQIADMTDGEVVKVDEKRKIVASTLPFSALPKGLEALLRQQSLDPQILQLDSGSYAVTVVPRFRSPQAGTVLLLLPQESLDSLREKTIKRTIVISLCVLLIAMGLAALLASRISRRFNRLTLFFDELASGQYPSLALDQRNDEVNDLIVSANMLSGRLQELQEKLKATERLSLLSQLSGGLAHQLRNSITGSRMAIQLYQRNHDNRDHSLLDTAMMQLRLTEEQVNAVLSLKKDSFTTGTEKVDLRTLIQDVGQLLEPQCLHWKTTFKIRVSDHPLELHLKAPQAVKGAILNLVLNGVEAAGAHGAVVCSALSDSDVTVLKIRDNGPGFPSDGRELTAAFQTDKPEGIGIGLTIAKHAFDNEGASVGISREDGWTHLTVSFPHLRDDS